MGNLLRFEFMKLFKSRKLYICALVIIFIEGATITVSKLVGNDLLQTTVAWEESANFFSAIEFSFMLCILTSLFVCDDYQNGTIKNILARGYSRSRVSNAKYVVAFVGCLILLACGILTNLIGYTIIGCEMGSFTSAIGHCFLYGFFGVWGLFTVYFLIANLTGKAGGAIAGGIVLPTVVPLVLTLVQYLAFKDADFSLSDYWLENIITGCVSLEPVKESVHIANYMFPIYIVLFSVISFAYTSKKNY